MVSKPPQNGCGGVCKQQAAAPLGAGGAWSSHVMGSYAPLRKHSAALERILPLTPPPLHALHGAKSDQGPVQGPGAAAFFLS